MKVAPPKDNGFQKKSKLLLSLEEDPDETYVLDKTNSIIWELSTRPGTADAATYKYPCRILTGDEEIRQILRWHQDVLKVCVGLDATDLEARRPIVTSCLRTGPLAIFDNAMEAQARKRYNETMAAAIAIDRPNRNTTQQDIVRGRGEAYYQTNAHIEVALQIVVKNYLPRQVLAKVKRALRRDMRKPATMKVRR